MLHHPAHPDHRGDLIFRQPDALAAQVFRRADAGIGADVDAGVPEQPRHEGGDADIVRIPRGDGADIARERQLRDVEFLIAERAEEDLLRVERQIGDLAALHLDAAIPDRAGAVIVAACNRYRHLNHGGSSSALLSDGSGKRAVAAAFLASVRASISAGKPPAFGLPCTSPPCCAVVCAIISRRDAPCRACSLERGGPRS